MAATIDPFTGLPTSNTPTQTSGVITSAPMPAVNPVASYSALTSNPTNPLQGSLTPPPVAPVSTAPTNVALAQTAFNSQTLVPAQQDANRIMSQLRTALGADGSTSVAAQKAAEEANLTKQYDIAGKQNLVNSLSGQIKGNLTGAQAQALGADRLGGVNAQQYAAEGARYDREATIKNLNLSAQLQAAQGDLTGAQNTINQAITAKYAPQEAQIQNLKDYLQLNAPELARQDAKALAQQNAMLSAAQKDLAEQKQNDTDISNLITNAAGQGAPADLIAKANLAKTPKDAAMVLGQFAGDYLKNQLLKEQISKVKAEAREQQIKNSSLTLPMGTQNKILANINAGKVQIGQLVSSATGDIPKNISADKQDGIIALKDLTKKVAQYSELYDTMEKQAVFGGAGLATGVKSSILPSTVQSQMEGLRGEITDLLARARSGAALTAYETSQYEDKIPGPYNTSFGIGTQGTEKLKSFASSLNGTLGTKLAGYGVTFASTPEEDYLDSVEKAHGAINTQSNEVSSYTRSLMAQ
jgi:hypothetical protein